MHRLWLIGLREFKAYVATWSFWVALAFGPVLMLTAAGLLAASQRPPTPIAIDLTAPSALQAEAVAALNEAAQALPKPIAIVADGPTRITIEDTPAGVSVRIEGQPLPAAAASLFKADLARRLAGAPALELSQPAPVRKAADPEAGVRFGLVFMLWLTLTGSLGMLLQAVVRERANRALDSLMAAAQPVEIVFGKLLGVGAVSVLVLTSWLATAAGLGAFIPAQATGALHGVLAAFADPRLLIQAGGVYILAYVMYGSVTVALGAAAEDTASAQNLSRPLFGVLLIAFFGALISTMGGAQSLSWMLWVPPLTPFMLLLTPTEALSAVEALGALAITAASALTAGWIAARCLTGPRASGPSSPPTTLPA